MREEYTEAYLSLGSNLGDRERCLEDAVSRLNEEIGAVFARSSFYETEPWGFDSEHLFLNMAVGVKTLLDPFKVLDACKRIEREMGRLQSGKEGYDDRPIDIDLLFYGERVIKEETLEVPHPKLHLRRFVLEPLSEIAPRLAHPKSGKTIEELKNNIND